MKRLKITVGMVNYNGEMGGLIFKNSVAIVDREEGEVGFAQERVAFRLSMLVPGTTCEEIDAEAPVQDCQPAQLNSTTPARSKPVSNTGEVVFATEGKGEGEEISGTNTPGPTFKG